MSHPQTSEHTVLQVAQKHVLLRARDVVQAGLPTVVLTRLVSAGKLERVGRGVYSLPNQPISENRSLAEVAIRVPRGVVCLVSALSVHDIGTQLPHAVWLALPRQTVSPRIASPSLRIIRMSGSSLIEGIDKIVADGVEVRVFNAAKTVADCFKFRNKIGLDVALEALHDGWRNRRFTMDELWHYAVVNRVANVMRPYLESVAAS
ncbi:MAG: type IV toxin-antitoxin system AbiEi family antitoxin domain-containing protein [Betaproteobacteria bacterium]|nr:type IV toxin-antitoxin system AbiEi family antitoxin domain-containing protein [Betaproteobacteria bacterium]